MSEALRTRIDSLEILLWMTNEQNARDQSGCRGGLGHLLYVGHGVDALEVQDRVRRQLHPDPNSNTSTDVFVSPQHSSHLFGGSGCGGGGHGRFVELWLWLWLWLWSWLWLWLHWLVGCDWLLCAPRYVEGALEDPVGVHRPVALQQPLLDSAKSDD